jgi:ubiquinone/menaquinone biosynthesis C-methylase UbiE
MNKIKKVVNKNIDYKINFLNPDEIISSLGLLPGMKIAHFGCGTGFFTFPTAGVVDEEGVVYAFDILQEKIETVASRAKLDGLYNVLAKRVNLEEEKGTGLETESVDWVFMVNMLYENEKKSKIIAEARRILKLGGKMLIIDWEDIDQSIGPNIKNRVSKEELEKIVGENKLAISQKIKVSSFHFGWILSK